MTEYFRGERVPQKLADNGGTLIFKEVREIVGAANDAELHIILVSLQKSRRIEFTLPSNTFADDTEIRLTQAEKVKYIREVSKSSAKKKRG